MSLEEQRAARAKRRDGNDDDDDEDEDEDDNEDDDPNSVFTFDRKKEKKVTIAEGDDDDDDDEEEDRPKGLLAGLQRGNNPNLVKKTGEKMIKAKDLANMDGPTDEFAGMNRKEREALEAQRKHEEYMRRTAAGETEQGRKDLERLAAIRKKREEDRLKREAEGRAPGWTPNGVASSSDSDDSDDSDNDKPKVAKPAPKAAEPVKLSDVAAKKKAAAAEVAPESSNGALPILKSIDIKKLNGDGLKDALKARGLPYDGQKKDLIKRLTDYEASRS